MMDLGEQYQALCTNVEESLGQQNVLLREHRKRIEGVTAEHVAKQQDFDSFQANATTAEEKAKLEEKWNTVYTSLTQTLTSLHGMEAHRRTFVYDNLHYYATRVSSMSNHLLR